MEATNSVPARDGRVSAVCRFCGRKSRPVLPDSQGEPDLFAMPRGWTQAAYSPAYQHADGSVGSLFTCPSCDAQLRAGKPLTARSYITASIIAKAIGGKR